MALHDSHQPLSARAAAARVDALAAVLVTDLAPAAGEDDLVAFFAFCGPVRSVSLTEAGAHEGVVVFAKRESRDMALLLDKAIVCGASISVAPVPDDRIAELLEHLPAADAGTGAAARGRDGAHASAQLAVDGGGAARADDGTPAIAKTAPASALPASATPPAGGAAAATAAASVDADVPARAERADEHRAGAEGGAASAAGGEAQPEADADAEAEAEQRQAASVIARLLAAGYILADETKQRAAEFDERRKISASLRDRAARFEDRHHVAVKAKVAGGIALGAGRNILSKAREKGSAAKERVVERARHIKDESDKLVQEKRSSKHERLEKRASLGGDGGDGGGDGDGDGDDDVANLGDGEGGGEGGGDGAEGVERVEREQGEAERVGGSGSD